MILELQADAKMALARYESSVAAFGKEASFSIKDVHSVNDYISKLEAIVEKAADRIEQLEAALRKAVPHLDDNYRYSRDMQAHAGVVTRAFEALEIARAALGEKKDDG
jgi:flagellar biosynthesis chaperone FliJ